MQTEDTIGLSDEAFAKKEVDKMIYHAQERITLTQETPLSFNKCVLTLDKDCTISFRQKGQKAKLETVEDAQ
ncbi:hypothetical protein K470DRAFT_219181 [Piedraia hortae CBS 480.64]|uniref:Uncharacterized protein n=1 Tax=Piedraia hortae CBS 480.64 TaxID=1314780 RepID=A0A6A7BXZ3_9PEZI|nr:hypothetical protein K470DRAFT_219181 [Piedraia hortae CBS 480.64]